MRLKQIKLSGFKSFVDPTSFDLPGRLVGVVGPNGCGKSNIIDAVRWVLGESKASELRGESMQDVIFSGSSERKPAARASVELVFENAHGRVTGPWAGFGEISVKRVLTRDGQSSYQINHQVVRRKDVHDMFLGTGLGPRAYAIIGQGTISRIIEARPEDLRVFLEEAAGVSRYKERRRETENRLADTRENLTRVEDILRELNGQVEKLERQAEVAQQYRQLEADRELRQHTLWMVRADEAGIEQARVARLREKAQTELEAETAGQRAVEARLEQLRVVHQQAGDAVHAAQGAYYEANAEVSRLESEIRFVADSHAQLRERLASLAARVAQARERSDAAAGELESIENEREAQRERLELLGARLDEAAALLPDLEQALREARAAAESAQQRASDTARQSQVLATRRHAVEEAIGQLSARRDRLAAERDALEEPPTAELERLEAESEEAAAVEAAAQERVAGGEAAWAELEAQRGPAQEALRAALARVHQVDARIATLAQLQQRLLAEGTVAPWLERHGLARRERLWQRVRIDDGWETAVEAMLRERVQAIELDRLDDVVALAADAPPSKIGFHAADAALATETARPTGLVPLASRVHSGDAALSALLTEWLHGCYVAEKLEDALARRGELPPGASFVVPAGHAVGRGAVHLYAPETEQEGVLVRQHELENLSREHRALELLAAEAREQAARIETAAGERLARLGQERELLAQTTRRLAGLRLDAQRLQQRVERASQQRQRLDAELAEIAEQIAAREAELAVAADQHEQLDLEGDEQREALSAARERTVDAERRVDEAREALRRLEREHQEAEFAARALETRARTLSATIDDGRRVAEQAAAERDGLQSRLEQLSDEAAQAALQSALARRVETERELVEARQRLDDLAQQLRQAEEQRMRHERGQEPLRQQLMDLQLKEQAAQLAAEQFATQLREADVALDALRERVPEPPKASWLQAEVTRLSNAIAALGAVNLAALDELNASKERRNFLDAQSADLNEAITTLEDAIRRIDRETRGLLQTTYDTVNRHFGELFPALFGGGEARLVLTGDEILDAGVQVIAQPPGKRNTSIHLLSGGEKALTAIALVFAMFQLNPAPFCLLDEVDAPLDDANTERYCDMVTRMSEQTQFVFITHNKIAMEMGQQLIGVTMQERGVSRIVAVDLEAAAGFAEAA